MLTAIFFLGGLFLTLGVKIMGGEAGYKHVLSIFSYSLLIDALATIVKTPLVYARGTMFVHTGLGILFEPEDYRTPTYALISKFDFFTIWQLMVLTIGISVLCRFSRGKSAGLVFGLWLIWIAVGAGMTALGGMFS